MLIYDQLWNEAVHALGENKPDLDSHLLDLSADHRRGVSILIRPTATVKGRISNFVNQLAAEFPGQYFHQPDQLHVTVLTLISATELWRQQIRDLPAFRRILGPIFRRHQPFDLEFRGVTAAPNAAMVQGFPASGTLEAIRADVRQAFAANGFADQLDRRYRSQAAHITFMRFCHPQADWRRLLSVLQANRQTEFGQSRVESVELVFADWYASISNLRVLKVFPLSLDSDDTG